MGAEVIRLGLAKPDDLRVTLGARSLQLGRGGHHWWPPRHAGDRWVPVQPTPRASGLGFVPGPSPRGLYPTGAWHAKKRESLKSCRPAGLYKDNWGPPGLAPELGIINKSPGSPPCPLVCLMLPGHGFTSPRENPLSCSFREPVLGLLTWFAKCPPECCTITGSFLCPLRRGKCCHFSRCPLAPCFA